VKRAHQVLVKLSDGEWVIAEEMANGATVPALIRMLLVKEWKERKRREKREERRG
jgi:hypothetical protein